MGNRHLGEFENIISLLKCITSFKPVMKFYSIFFLMSAWLIALWQWVYIDVIKPLPEILHCKFSCNRIEAYTASIVVGDGFFGKSVKLSKKNFQGWREGHIIKLRNVFNIRANYHCDTLHYSPTPLHTLTHANYKSAQTTKLRTDVLN